LHVFLFSSNVPLKDELELKAMAHDRGLLCMGPDCGTSIIAGKGLGFANAVRRGSVGIVGASGTGIQVVSTLLDQFGVGVSHAIGCGSRDLTNEVGGATAIAGLDALLRDDSTQVVVLISKPAPAEVTARLRERAAQGIETGHFRFSRRSVAVLPRSPRSRVKRLRRSLSPHRRCPSCSTSGCSTSGAPLSFQASA